MGAKKWQKPKDYMILMRVDEDEVKDFLEDFSTIGGCTYKIGSYEIDSMPGFRYVTLTVDHNKHKTKEVVEKKVEMRFGRPIKKYNYTVAEVYEYCKEHNQQGAARYFGIPYRSFQRYIAKVKSRGAKPEDNWNAENNGLFVAENLTTKAPKRDAEREG